MRKRTTASVVRFPSFSVISDDYYYSLLMLFLPHITEVDLIGTYSSAKEAFEAKHSNLDTSMQTYCDFLHQVETSIRKIRIAEEELSAHASRNNTVDIQSITSVLHIPFNTSMYLQDNIHKLLILRMNATSTKHSHVRCHMLNLKVI